MKLTPSAYALLGLTAIVAALVTVVVFAVLKFVAAARDTRRNLHRGSMETTVLAAALQDAVGRLKAQERATAARADASERLSGEIVQSLTAGLIVVGLDGSIRIFNPAGRRMLELSDSAAPDDLRPKLHDLGLMPVIHECLANHAPILRSTLQLPEGACTATHLGLTVSPLVDEARQVHGAICLFSDLTAVKDLEEQLRLKQSLAVVGELTAGIAHEFRNGLATIHGYSRLIDPAALPAAYRPYVEGIRAETDLLRDIVTNFLNFARPAQLTLSRVDLRSVCDRVAEDARVEARVKGGDVEVRGHFGAIDGDEVLLRQAFSNLLRNAIEACVGASVAPVVTILSEIDPVQKISRISVNDNGPGIEPDARDRVFRPFFTAKRDGTGLGLALVQKIIVFHNGRITVGTSPQGGASLQVTLPNIPSAV